MEMRAETSGMPGMGARWPEAAYLLPGKVWSEADIDVGAAIGPFRSKAADCVRPPCFDPHYR